MKNIIKLASILVLFTSSIVQTVAADVNLYFTRHGKTMFNTAQRVQGWSDTPLTKPAIGVVRFLGKGLRGTYFIAVSSSHLGRAIKTARLVVEAKGE